MWGEFMLKKITYLLFSSILFFVTFQNVYADESLKCTYLLNENIGDKVIVTVENNNLNVSIYKKNPKYGYVLDDGASRLSIINFQSTEENKWKCPDKLHFKTGKASLSGAGTIHITELSVLTSSTSGGENDKTATKVESECYDGFPLSTTPSNTTSCRYGNLVITYNDTTFSHNSPCTTTKFDFTQKDFTNGQCPSRLYIGKSANNYCTYYLEEQPSIQGGWIELNGDEPPIEYDDIDDEENEEDDIPQKPDYSFSYKCVSCGNGALQDIPAQLPQFVRNIITVVQTLIPVLLIGLGMFDFVKAVVASDEKAMQESQRRFIRRIIAAVLIFLIVAIVKFVFALIPGDNLLGCVSCFISDKNSCGVEYECVSGSNNN